MIRLVLVCTILLTVFAGPADARENVTEAEVARASARAAGDDGSFWSQFRDPQDGAFDTSRFLATKTGFLPVPILITEPAVGYGGGLALAFFHDTNKDANGKVKTAPDGRPVPPSASAVGGFGTENGTWGAFGGHMGVWNDDRIRYTGGGGYVSANLSWYGLASDVLGRPYKFNIEGFGLVQDIKFRISTSSFWVGARYSYLNATVEFERLLPIPGIRPISLDSSNAGLGLYATWDSRDNFYSPDNGVLASALTTVWDPALGGDYAYVSVDAYALLWKQVAPKLNLGLRVDGRYADSGAPFWATPFIQLRGIPAMRYQGNQVLVAEGEARYDLNRRWSVVGFAGVGRATRDLSDLPAFIEDRGESQNAWNAGGGIRYLISRAMGLRVGVDVARGPEDWAFYITVGNGWLRL